MSKANLDFGDPFYSEGSSYNSTEHEFSRGIKAPFA